MAWLYIQQITSPNITEWGVKKEQNSRTAFEVSQPEA